MTKKQKDKQIKCVKRKQNKKTKRELSIVMSGQFCTLAIFLSWILQHIMSKGGRQCQGHFTPLSLSCRGDCIGVYVFFWSLKLHFWGEKLTFRKSWQYLFPANLWANVKLSRYWIKFIFMDLGPNIYSMQICEQLCRCQSF